MTQKPFKVGDEIIMTADSGKGATDYYPNGEYKGKVTGTEDTIDIRVEGYIGKRSFDKRSRINICFPGLSIRHADEVSAIIEQEWVRGQAPEVGERETAIWLWKDGWEKPLYYTAIERIIIFSYTH